MKNKIITCSDLHGRDTWKLIDPKEYFKLVFLGDYVDSFHISNTIMKQNLLDIIQFKKDNIDKVILLLGNHDIGVIHSPLYRCSGFRPEMLWDFQEIFRDNRKLFQVAYQVNNYLWSHAGLHKGYYKYKIEPHIEKEDVNLADTLNRMYEMNMEELHDVGLLRGGSNSVGGIFWADKNESSKKPLPGYHQIVGHHPVEKITITKSDSCSITYTDIFSYKEKFNDEVVIEKDFYILEI